MVQMKIGTLFWLGIALVYHQVLPPPPLHRLASVSCMIYEFIQQLSVLQLASEAGCISKLITIDSFFGN